MEKYFNSGKGEKGRIVLERDSGPKGGKGQEKGGKGDTRVCWSCGKPGHIAAKCVKGSWNRSLTKKTSVKKCMKTKMICMRGVSWRSARTSNGRSPARNRN